MEIRCCSKPENLVGAVGLYEGLQAGLWPRELDDGTFAFENDETVALETIPGFVRNTAGKGGSKSWKRSWKKK